MCNTLIYSQHIKASAVCVFLLCILQHTFFIYKDLLYYFILFVFIFAWPHGSKVDPKVDK